MYVYKIYVYNCILYIICIYLRLAPLQKKPSIFFSMDRWQFDDFRKISLGRDVVQHPMWNAFHFINRRESGKTYYVHFTRLKRFNALSRKSPLPTWKNTAWLVRVVWVSCLMLFGGCTYPWSIPKLIIR